MFSFVEQYVVLISVSCGGEELSTAHNISHS